MLNSQESNQIFSTTLLPSERLLWTGQPDPGQAARRATPALLFGAVWMIMILVIIAIGVWGTLSYKMGIAGIFFVIFTLPFLAMGVLLLATPTWARMKAKNCYYAITDKRTIAVEDGKTRTVKAFNLSDLSAPYVVGGRGCQDLCWALQPMALDSAQSVLATNLSPSGLSTKPSQWQATGSSGNQVHHFEFSCLPDATAAFEIAKNQNTVLEQQRQKSDPLGLDQIRTSYSQGKLFVFSGLDMCEFDGTRVINRKNIATQASFIVGPIVLCFATIFGLNFATNIINAKNGGIGNLIPMAMFTLFLVLGLINAGRAGSFARTAAAIGAPPVDFSNSKVIAKLQQIYAAQSSRRAPQRNFFEKLVGYIVAIIALGGFGAMMLVPMWASYQELQKALHPQQVVEKPVEEGISGLREQVRSAEKKVAKPAASIADRQDNLNWLANRREWLANAQIEASAPADAVEQYAKALPERYEQLDDSSSKEAYDKILIDVGRDAIWYADCLRDLKKLKAIDSLAAQLVDEIERTSKAKHFDPLTEKQVLIKQMTLALKTAGYDNAQTDVDTRLKQLQKAPTKEREAGFNKLIALLLDSMH